MRFVTAEDRNGVGTLQALDRLLQGLEEVAVVQVIHQVGDDFGVRLAFEDVAGLGQFGAQFIVILDDAVVDGCNARRAVLARKVRMGVVCGGRTGGGPACIGNTREGGELFLGHLLDDLRHTLGAAGAAELTVCMDSDSAGVVAAVFQTLQPLKQNRGDVAFPYCTNDSTHVEFSIRVVPDYSAHCGSIGLKFAFYFYRKSNNLFTSKL